MKIGIAGFSGSGKSTVFHWLSGVTPDPAKSQHGQLGKPDIPDERLDWLSQHFKPKKTTPAKIEFLDTPGLLLSERRDNARRLGIMRDAGGLLVVLNGFTAGDPAAELLRFREELVLADLEVVTGRLERLEGQLKKPRPAKEREADQHELALVKRVAAALEQGQGAAALGLKDDEEKTLRSFQLLTLKPELVLLNRGDDAASQPVPEKLRELAPSALQAPARLERELEELTEEDRQAFMKDLNLTGFSRPEILRRIFYGMNQIVFFTVGEDECRAWPIPKGASAVEGAAEIHTDLARGFVRGEVVSFDDFKKVGSMKEAKARGVYRLEAKTYIVQDGDILHILASA